MASNPVNIATPVGRIVQGNLYKANDKDADGNPLIVKNGANAGQPRVQFYYALAIPKNPGEQSWDQTPWGAQIYEVGRLAFPQQMQNPNFSWKCDDGDSQIPNQKGVKNCDREGFPGNWIIKFSSGIAPKIVKVENGTYVQMDQVDAIKPGYFVQVNFNVASNDSTQRPGVYINPQKVCFRAIGDEIFTGISAEEAFGAPASNVALPAGASTMPSAVPLPGQAAALPPNPSQAAAPNATGVPAAASAMPTVPVAVQPNTGFLNVPQSAGNAAVPPAPASIPAPVATSTSPSSRMTAKAGPWTYEQLIANGFTDASLIAEGYMNP